MGDYFSNILVAAEAGDSFGQYNLAVCYQNGWGTKVNIDQAKYWFNQQYCNINSIA